VSRPAGQRFKPAADYRKTGKLAKRLLDAAPPDSPLHLYAIGCLQDYTGLERLAAKSQAEARRTLNPLFTKDDVNGRRATSSTPLHRDRPQSW
jgi:hypothetical protein